MVEVAEGQGGLAEECVVPWAVVAAAGVRLEDGTRFLEEVH